VHFQHPQLIKVQEKETRGRQSVLWKLQDRQLFETVCSLLQYLLPRILDILVSVCNAVVLLCVFSSNFNANRYLNKFTAKPGLRQILFRTMLCVEN